MRVVGRYDVDEMDALTVPYPHERASSDDASERPASRPPDREAAARAGGGVARGTAGGLAAGDPKAIERFYRESFGAALGVARRASGRDEAFCLDAVHDGMLRLLKCVRGSLTEEQLDLYMKRSVVSACRDALRKERRRLVRERARGELRGSIVGGGEGIGPDEVREALLRLDGVERDLLASRFLRGQSMERAGAAHGITGPAAHGRVRRAIARLRELLGEES